MNTKREICYDADDHEILQRIKETRRLLDKRRSELRQWTSLSVRQQEQSEIEYLDELVRWLQFGGPQPFWIRVERELSEDESFEVLT